MCYILKHATVITMDDSRIFYDADVFVANGKIYRIGCGLSATDVPEIDCTGKFLIPGLMDSHIHMDSAEITEMLLANGVTACCNMWGIPLTQQWIREIEEGKRLGPKVITTGPLTDGVTYWNQSAIVTTPEEAEKAVADCIRGGYDFFKTYPSIPRDAFFKVMETANTLGVKVMGHGNYNVSWPELVRSGYYSLEHVMCLPEKEEDILMLAESGMWFCPTVLVGATIYRYVTLGIPLTETRNYESMCAFWHRDWQRITDWRKSLHRYDALDWEKVLERARLFVKHSDQVVMGTDVPNPGVTGGYSMFEEMEYMRDVFGMSPYRILRTCTTNAARRMGIQHEKGMLKEGMDADILILDKDPLEDILHTQSFTSVIREGRQYSRAFLDDAVRKVRTYTEAQIQPWCI